MPDRPGLRVAAVLWAVAASAIGIAALVSPARPSDVVGLVVVGHSLWGLAWFVERSSRKAMPAPRAVGFLTILFAGFALVEGLGLSAALGEGRDQQALWFLLALTFASAGIPSVRRAEPTDAALACQLLLHGLMAMPALAVAFGQGLRARAGPAGAGPLIAPGPLIRTLIVIAQVGAPALFAGLLGALVIEGTRRGGRSLTWSALLGHEAAFVLIAARWAADGL